MATYFILAAILCGALALAGNLSTAIDRLLESLIGY
jgi:hypothetical protein